MGRHVLVDQGHLVGIWRSLVKVCAGWSDCLLLLLRFGSCGQFLFLIQGRRASFPRQLPQLLHSLSPPAPLAASHRREPQRFALPSRSRPPPWRSTHAQKPLRAPSSSNPTKICPCGQQDRPSSGSRAHKRPRSAHFGARDVRDSHLLDSPTWRPKRFLSLWLLRSQGRSFERRSGIVG